MLLIGLISIFPEGLQLCRGSAVKLRLVKTANPDIFTIPSCPSPSSLVTLASYFRQRHPMKTLCKLGCGEGDSLKMIFFFGCSGAKLLGNTVH